jgi:hypothetical protein
MEIGINLQIQMLKENLTKVINDSKLPIAITQMALFELTAQVNNVAAQQIQIERQAFEKAQEEVKTDGKEIHKA